MRLLSFLLVLSAALAPGQQPSQGTITVAVRSNASTINDAAVSVDGHSIQTGTDGVALLHAIPGQADVTVNKDGFFPAHATVVVVAAKQVEVDFELQPKQTEEQEVTVYATRTDVRMEDSPLHVEVVSQDEINEELAMRPGDISMMLNEMGGMRVQTTSPGLGAASLRLQGMLGRYTAFLSDGLPLFGQQGAGLRLLQIPPMDLDQLEIIKGNARLSTAALRWPGL